MPGPELEALLAARDHRGVAVLLNGLDESALDAAGRWYRRTGRKQAREVHDDRWADGHAETRTIVLLLAVALAATGRDAARACGFTDASLRDRTSVDRLLGVLEIAARRGPGWAQDFVESASQVKVRRPWEVSEDLVQLCLPLVDHHGLDVPSGPAYVDGWVELAVQLQHRPSSPEWERWLVQIDGAGRAARVTAVRPETGLAAFLRATPRLQQTLERVLETPAALGRLGDLDQPGWALEDGVRLAIGEGLVAREALVGAVLTAYTRSDRPSEQRVTTQVLAAVGFGPQDAATRLPFLLQVLPTVHGSVTAALLPALLAAPLQPDDLLDVGSTILLRKEKAQKVVLLDRLELIGAGDALAGAAVELWRQAAQGDDRTLAARAEHALERLGVVDEQPGGPAFEVPWDDAPAPPPVGPFRPAERSAAGLARLRTESPFDPSAEARWLDLIVRYGAAEDLDALRSEVRDSAPVEGFEPRTSSLLRRWAAGRPVEVDLDRGGRSGFASFVAMLAAETLLRLGPPFVLLSTPSRADGSLTFDDLVARLRDARLHGYGPVDLLQALLRLEPTDPGRLGMLDGLEVAPYDRPPTPRRWWQRATAVVDDAVPVVRSWVAGGGLPDRVAVVLDGRASCPPVRLPAMPPGLVGHPVVEALAAAVDVPPDETTWSRWRSTWLSSTAVLGVAPPWSEAVAADRECILAEHRSWDAHTLAALVGAPGRLGPAVHLHAARLLGGPSAEERAEAVDAVLVAVGQRRLDPALFAGHSLVWCSSGLTPIARTSEAWEQVVLGGGLAFLWPTLHAVLQHVTTRSPKPAGLAELLRMLRPYAATIARNVPGPVWPAGVAALAGSSSASKARAEAQALVTAVAAVREAA